MVVDSSIFILHSDIFVSITNIENEIGANQLPPGALHIYGITG
jgi:hypothetical protein